MKRLNIEQYKGTNLEVSLSIASLVDLPSQQFNPDSWVIGNPWRKCVNKLVFRSILSLLLSDLLQVEYSSENKTYWWGLIKHAKTRFELVLVSNERDFSKLSWLEKLLLHSLEQAKSNYTHRSLVDQLRIFLKLLFDNKSSFCNPWKKIVEKIILKDNKKNLNYKVSSTWSAKQYQLDTAWKNSSEYRKVLTNTDKAIDALKKNEMNEKFIAFLEKQIDRLISEKQSL